MTVIVALHIPEKGTWVGSDTRVTSGLRALPVEFEKYAYVGDFVFLQAGHPRAIQVIRGVSHRLSPIKNPMQMASEVRQAFKDDGFAEDGEPGPASYDQAMLMASASGVWSIDPAFSVIPWLPNCLAASGSGSSYALGADYAVQNKGAEIRIKAALEAAAQFDTACGGPFFLDFLKMSKGRSK